MQRRQYLSVAASGTLVAIAGCSSDGDAGGDDTGTGNGRSDETDGSDDGGEERTENGGEERTENGDEADGSIPTEFASIRTADDRYDPGVRRFDAARTFRSDTFALEDGLTVVTFEHIVGREFAIELFDAAGSPAASIVDHYGPVEGAVAVPTIGGDYSLDVTNVGGYWEVEVAQPRTPEAAVRAPPVEASGTGFDVVGTVGLGGSATVGATHDGESDFGLACYDENATGTDDATVVFEEVGEFEAETTVQFDATAWIAVEADGAWTFEIR